MCTFPSPTIKYEGTFYQVETRTEQQKDVLQQGRTWNKISDSETRKLRL